MKFATAIRHLEEMADACTEKLRLRDSGIGWPLEELELWVTGELLDGPDSLEWGSVVLVLDLPPDELPWLAKHPTAEWIGSQLRLGNRPFRLGLPALRLDRLEPPEPPAGPLLVSRSRRPH